MHLRVNNDVQYSNSDEMKEEIVKNVLQKTNMCIIFLVINTSFWKKNNRKLVFLTGNIISDKHFV